MSYHYSFQEVAQEDYENALQWYKERSEQAARNFIIDIDKALKIICENPTRWRNEYSHYFELGLKRYPYTIIYSIQTEMNLIDVLSIFHQKRNPKYKYQRRK